MKLLIDNGHGVSTPGKRSPDGVLREYAWTRQVARMLKALLDAEAPELQAELLVPEDADISLGQRCARANAVCDRLGAKNVLLVSLHLNAAGNGTQWMAARGWEAWTSPGRTASDTLAERLYDAAATHLPEGTPIRTDTADGDRDKEARFQILTGTECPAVLTENLFMDNRRECTWLMTAEGRRAIARLHAEAVKAYFKKLSK